MKFSKKYLNTLIFLLFGGFLFWIAFKDLDLVAFKNSLKTIPFKWVFLSMFLGYAAFIFRGLRWRLLIKPNYITKKADLIHAIAFGYLFNSFIPRSGEVIRCTAVNKVSGIPVSELFGHVLLERLIDFIMLGICIILVVVLNYNHFLLFSQGFIFPTYLFFILIILTTSCILIYKFQQFIFNEEILKKIKEFWTGIKNGFLSIKDIPNKYLFFFYTLSIWGCYLFMTIVCFYCFKETLQLNLAQGLFIMVAGGLGMVVPTPTGIGSYHYLVIKALTILGISREIAQFFAIIVHTSQAIMIIITGVIGMLFLYRRSYE